jgi:hypothetical protein
MEPKEMNRIIREDLEHIGDAVHGTPQRVFRGCYISARQSQLGAKGDPARSRGDVIREAVAAMRVSHPDFEPDYDHEWFGNLE